MRQDRPPVPRGEIFIKGFTAAPRRFGVRSAKPFWL
jgi:hypothetical protein